MKRNNRQGRGVLGGVMLLLLVAVVCILASACASEGLDPLTQLSSAGPAVSSSHSSASASTSSSPSSSSAPVPDPSSESSSVSQESSSASFESESTSQESTSSSSSRPEVSNPDLAFLDNSVFIGDSIVEGLLAYNVVGNADVFAYIGINPKTIQQKKFVERDGKTLTVVDAVRGQSYDKAYVMIGANGVSWLTKKTFTREYEKFLDELIEVMPDTIIYVQSMLPVLESKLKGEDRAITNELIIEYNDALQEMVATKPSTVIYLDLWPAFAVDGSLTSQDAEPDGVHLRMKAYKRWVSYLHEIT